jgi:hypothetical protein
MLSQSGGGRFHRHCIFGSLDTKVDFKNFAFDPSKPGDVRSLSELVTIVGGKNPKILGGEFAKVSFDFANFVSLVD